MTRKSLYLDHATLQRIWDAYRLGRVETVTQAGRGINNPAFIINDQYVLRLDGLDLEGRSRFYGEALAYQRLHEQHIPAPRVLAIDVSKRIVPHDLLLMTKIAGSTVIDSWPTLNPADRHQVAWEAGRYLAMMHDITFDGYGRLHLPADDRFPTWYGYIADYVQRYGSEAITEGILSTAQGLQLQRVFIDHRTIFDTVAPPRLVHWDFHFENVLQEHGHVTGILDFEWSLCGDPAYDFRQADQWEETCPASTQSLINGYLSLRPLLADHPLRVRLYSLLGYLDWAVDAHTPDERIWARAKLLEILSTFM
jgi:aminoglycoside phosphotransferase (APT) family kinase protein